MSDEPSRSPWEPNLSADWPEDASHENGNYFCRCIECDCQFVGHKRRVICKTCDERNRRAGESE